MNVLIVCVKEDTKKGVKKIVNNIILSMSRLPKMKCNNYLFYIFHYSASVCMPRLM